MKNGIKKYTCIGCGAEVEKPCVNGMKYCSADCYHRNKPKVKNKKGFVKKCIICENEFYVPINRADKAITCSVACSNAFQGRNKTTITCLQCGKEKTLSPSFVNQRYCSKKCYNESDEFKKMLAENNARNNRNHLNNFEKMAYSLLDELGIKYVPQFIIGNKFTVDAFIRSKNTVLQFDGDYWHGNPDKFQIPDQRQKKENGS